MDVGELTLEKIYKLLLIDAEWSWQTRRSFNWIAYRLAQTTSASEVFVSREVAISRIVSRVVVVEDVGVSQDEAESLVGHLNHLAVGGAYIYVPEGRVETVLAHNVHDETAMFRPQQIGAFQMLQLAFAELHCERLASAFRGKIAHRAHPTSGPREHPDDMLNVVSQVYLPRGNAPSAFALEAEFAQVYNHVLGTELFSAGGSSKGIAIEAPFGSDDTSLIQLMTDVPHPHLGNGLGVFTVFRINADAGAVAKLANELNTLQFVDGEVVPALGAWCLKTVNNQASLGHAFFVPNVEFRPGVALDAAMCAMNQALWADHLLHPDLPDRSAVSIVAKRLARR